MYNNVKPIYSENCTMFYDIKTTHICFSIGWQKICLQKEWYKPETQRCELETKLYSQIISLQL